MELNSVVREEPELTALRDTVWEDRTYGWSKRVTIFAPIVFGAHTRHEMHLRFLSSYFEIYLERQIFSRDAYFRLLQTELALRLYKHKHKTYPAQLSDLVPKHLNAIPIDPYSGKPLIYRRIKDGYALYSVGQGGIDNGGKFKNVWASTDEGFDLDIHSIDGASRPAAAKNSIDTSDDQNRKETNE